MAEKRKVIIDGTEYEVDIEREGDIFKATVAGRTFEIEVPDAPKQAPRKSKRGGKGKKSGNISANIPGKVVTIDVSVGDTVTEGQVVMILEAMKMQNEITSPIPGTVKEIQCEEGQNIEANIPLMIIEPNESEDED